ncbi:MAG: hypothetical protein MI799_21900 [Desulfobacterales bacterium]|nr:hypothetical protein [Desulfobacterales bacterium]
MSCEIFPPSVPCLRIWGEETSPAASAKLITCPVSFDVTCPSLTMKSSGLPPVDVQGNEPLCHFDGGRGLCLGMAVE